MIADLTCFPHRWRRGFLVCFKDTSPECIPVEKDSVAIYLRSYHIFTGLKGRMRCDPCDPREVGILSCKQIKGDGQLIRPGRKKETFKVSKEWGWGGGNVGPIVLLSFSFSFVFTDILR